MPVPNQPEPHSLAQCIATQTGLNLRPNDLPSISRLVSSRCKLLGLASPEEYRRLLTEKTLRADTERQAIITGLTTAETYFFRDPGQCALLRDHILPELIGSPGQPGMLTLWSVGCATGEEPYTLAILLDQLRQRLMNWRVFILGTDLNPALIDKARQGVFGKWSFRGMPPEILEQYFHKHKQGWRIEQRIQDMVTFKVDTLAAGASPRTDSPSFDLIVCRNLFIYYNRAAVASLLARLTGCLREGGYLMTGHAEFDPREVGGLRARMFPASTVYQRVSKTPARPTPKTPPSLHADKPVRASVTGRRSPSPLPEKTSAVTTQLSEAEVLFQAGNYAAVIEKLLPFLQDNPLRHPDSAPGHLLLAHAYANQGRHAKASHHCRQSLNAAPLQPDPYYLLAQIAREHGDACEEKILLQKVIYLAPSHVAAYLDLGMIHDQEADFTAARRMRLAALDIVKQYPPTTKIPSWPDLTAGELHRHLQALLDDRPSASSDGRPVEHPKTAHP